jgi:hypothetical protein
LSNSQTDSNISWFGGYKKALEQRINGLLDGTVLTWEVLVDELRGRVHVGNLPLVSIYMMMLIAASSYSNFRVYAQYGTMIGVIQAALILVFLVVLLFAVQRAIHAFTRAYDTAVAKFATSNHEGT